MHNDPNKEQWLSWLDHPVTQYFFEVLKVKREGFIDLLAFGGREQRDDDKLIGRVAGYTDVLNTTFEE